MKCNYNLFLKFPALLFAFMPPADSSVLIGRHGGALVMLESQ